MLAVTGGKGGVGKSTVALNLAAALDAVLVDGDLAMADLPEGVGPDLHDVLSGRAAPFEAVQRLGDVLVLPCGRSLAGARASDVRALAGVLSALEESHGDVVVDCAAGLKADVGVPLAAADACVLVTLPSVPAVADGVRARELAVRFDAGIAGVALNRADDSVELAGVERALGGRAVALPASPALAAAVQRGEPASAIEEDGQAATAVRELGRLVQSCRSA